MTIRTAILAKCSGALLLSLILPACGSDTSSEPAGTPPGDRSTAAAAASEAPGTPQLPPAPTAAPIAKPESEPTSIASAPATDADGPSGGWRLANEASPYLRQHADNPVEWYPWGEEAFARAREFDRLIFLSIGYSSCHWCHVMEHETFMHEGVARVLNEHFVSIKVDREERPDVDERYMTALQLISGGRGGWPISMFLTPNGDPITGGTYFPAEDNGRMPGFLGVLDRVLAIWTDQHDEVVDSAGKFGDHLKLDRLPPPGEWDSKATLDSAATQLTGQLDDVWGGTRGAPKFPPTMLLQFLMRQHLRLGVTVVDIVRTTLDRMAAGGMHDHVGGGFHRYSTDARWEVPHFEKMLYDNAQLALTYAEAYALTGADDYARIARRTLSWLMTDMRSPEGLYFAARDADSPPYDSAGLAIEGAHAEEGLFYLWTPDQLRAALGEQDGASFARLFNVTDEGNFEHGASIARPMRTLDEIASDPGEGLPTGEAFISWLDEAFTKLAAARAVRPPAFRDEKCLAGWNGLALSAFARTGALLDDQSLRDEAASLADSMLANLFNPDSDADGGRLRHVRFEGISAGQADLFDHASIARGLLDAYEALGNPELLLRAMALTNVMLDLFEDTEGGGFFDTQGLDPNLPGRTRDVLDSAVPAGNSVAIEVLVRLAPLDDSGRFGAAAKSALDRVGLMVQQSPRPFAGLLAAVDAWHGPLSEIVIDGSGPVVESMLRHVRTSLLPAALLIPDARALEGVFPKLPSLLADRRAPDGEARAWVCVSGACLAPAKDVGTLKNQLVLLAPR